MSNKNLKGMGEAAIRLWEELNQLNPLTQEQLKELCSLIWYNADCGPEGYTAIDFKLGNQWLFPGPRLVAEATVLLQPKRATPSWVYHGEGNNLNDAAYIGHLENTLTGVIKTRAFWRFWLEETKEERYVELDSIYVAVIANFHEDDSDDSSREYAIVIRFNDGKLSILDFLKDAERDTVKAFITDIHATLKANPKRNSGAMPKEASFTELISKLSPVVSPPKPSDSEINNSPPPSNDKDNRTKALKNVANKKKAPLPSKSADGEAKAGDDAPSKDKTAEPIATINVNPGTDTDSTTDADTTDDTKNK